MFTFEKSVGAVIFRRENDQIKYLLLNHGEDYWNFPKGHIEEKETNEETLRREIVEETGLTDLQILPSFKRRAFYFYQAKGREKEERKSQKRAKNIFKRAVFYLVEAKNQEVRLSSEHTGFVWLDFEAALEKLKYKTSQRILQQAQAELEKFFAKKESLS
jgi:8-oxo-dGTP pyrophosphatase MutT (NUDIX family)